MSIQLHNFISKEMGEKILDWKKCKWCDSEYPLYEKEKKFLNTHNFELSKLCFDCRFRNMLLWRNEKKLYWRESDKSGKRILSLYCPEYETKVYNYDEWDAEGGFPSINSEFDGVDFLGNYFDLVKKIPKAGTDMFWINENIWYCNRVGYLKNAYSTYACFGDSEDIYFSVNISNSKDIYNSTKINNSNLVYDSVMVYYSYGIFFSDLINNCKNIYFSYDLRDCENCIFCNNLVGKSYMVYNKQYSKEEFENIKNTLKQKTASYIELEKLQKNFETQKIRALKKGTANIGGDKIIGDLLINSHNTILGFRMDDADNCFNSANAFPASQKNIFNSFGLGRLENANFILGSGPGTNIYFSINVEESSDIYYSQKMKGCHNCIGCYGLQNAEYHILNKSYSKEEYERLFPIILENIKKSGKQGDFFDPGLSPFPINDSQLFLEFPIYSIRRLKNYTTGDISSFNFDEEIYDKKGKGIIYILNPELIISPAIINFGGNENIQTKWRNTNSEVNIPNNMSIIGWQDLPDSISDFGENILQNAILCKETGRYFRTISKEIDFCKKYTIALSRIHPDRRIDNRRKRGPKLYLDLQNCKKCNKEIVSVYDSDSGYNVVCEECYNKEIY